MDYKEIVLRLIGEIEPIGEAAEDEKRYENLKNMCALVDGLIFEIYKVSKNADRYEASIRRAGECARMFLNDL